MGGQVAMNYAATIMGQHQEDVKNLEANGGHGEKIDGGKLRDMALKKSTPGLRRGDGCKARNPARSCPEAQP